MGATSWQINRKDGYTIYMSDKLYDKPEAACAENLRGLKFTKLRGEGSPKGTEVVPTFEADPSCKSAPATTVPTTAETLLPMTTETSVPMTTETSVPMTTNSCPPCRKVIGGPLSGMYTNVGSGDDRCTMDGCMYKKDDELYCFQEGDDTVEEGLRGCPTGSPR